jgi:hypothetical protein
MAFMYLLIYLLYIGSTAILLSDVSCLQAHGQAGWRLRPQPTAPPLTLATRQGRRPQPTTPRWWPQEPQPCAAQEPRSCTGEAVCWCNLMLM